MKKSLICLFMFLSTLTMMNTSQADSYTGNPHPPQFGPWELYQSRINTWTIDCVYKRYEIVNSTSKSKRVETETLSTPRYPFGRCPSTLTTSY